MDDDGDGKPDAFELDGDGTPDGPGIDTDGDGLPDAIGIDTDGDGIMRGMLGGSAFALGLSLFERMLNTNGTVLAQGASDRNRRLGTRGRDPPEHQRRLSLGEEF